MSESASALALEQDHQHFVESIKQGANNIMVGLISPLSILAILFFKRWQ